jgi:hypothetical protein
VSDDDAPNDGLGGPPWLPEIGKWFLAAGVMLLLPRQWVPAGVALLTGVVLSYVEYRRARR